MAVETPPEITHAKAETPVTVERLFRYSEWVDLGEGALECPAVDREAGTNECRDPFHFHAWCRLPNSLQEEQIHEKALAAKGRRMRVLRDPQTDASASLEAQLDMLAMEGDDAKDAIVAELMDKDRWRDLLAATGTVLELEEGVDADENPIHPFAHIRDDQRRLGELEALSEDEQEAVRDELVMLRSHLAKYTDTVQEHHKAITGPKEAALRDLDISALVDLARDLRIARDSNLAFANAYSRTVWLWCTLTQPKGKRVFAEPADLDDAAPEVIEAVSLTFDSLQTAQGEVQSGN